MWNVVSYLITGPAMFGLIGWGLDAWLGTTWLVAVGILAGMALSLYYIWFRYGTQ
jgi:Flp pilus assembly protein TadB